MLCFWKGMSVTSKWNCIPFHYFSLFYGTAYCKLTFFLQPFFIGLWVNMWQLIRYLRCRFHLQVGWTLTDSWHSCVSDSLCDLFCFPSFCPFNVLLSNIFKDMHVNFRKLLNSYSFFSSLSSNEITYGDVTFPFHFPYSQQSHFLYLSCSCLLYIGCSFPDLISFYVSVSMCVAVIFFRHFVLSSPTLSDIPKLSYWVFFLSLRVSVYILGSFFKVHRRCIADTFIFFLSFAVWPALISSVKVKFYILRSYETPRPPSVSRSHAIAAHEQLGLSFISICPILPPSTVFCQPASTKEDRYSLIVGGA